MADLGKLPYTLQSPFVDALKMINILQNCNFIDKRHQSKFSYDRLTGAGVRYYSLNVIPLSIRLILQKFGDYRQSLYNSAVLYALERKLLSQIVISVHTLLIAFRYYSEILVNYIEKIMSIQAFLILISLFLSRYHLAGYFILYCLLVIRLDFATFAMRRFYIKYPS